MCQPVLTTYEQALPRRGGRVTSLPRVTCCQAPINDVQNCLTYADVRTHYVGHSKLDIHRQLTGRPGKLPQQRSRLCQQGMGVRVVQTGWVI